MINKIKAVWYAFCIILLYYVVRPVDCVIRATIDSGLLHKGHFINHFKNHWEMEYGQPDSLWLMVKSLWNEEDY